MTFCLPKFAADAFRARLKSGEIAPEKLASMTSAERRSLFEGVVGEANAQKVNALFESKLLLKNQQLGMINWAKSVAGLKEATRTDLIAKVERLGEALKPEEVDAFLSDLVEQRLGFGVTASEAGKLLDLAKSVDNLRAQAEKVVSEPGFDVRKETRAQKEQRMEYGTALTLFKDYVESLKPEGQPLTFKEFITTPSKYVENIGGTVKSIVASVDNSFWGNQGISTLLNPFTTDIWIRNFAKSFKDIKTELTGGDSLLPTKADIYSRPNALNGKYAKADVKIGLKTEEAYPTSIPERIPILGKLFTASSNAYNNAALRLRADLADRWIKSSENAGMDMTDPAQAQGIGHITNSFTGRGSLGVLEAAAPKINIIVFSAKLMKGAFDTVTAHIFDPKVRSNPVALKLAAKNLIGMTLTYLAITNTIEALYPGHTERDLRGANFGKVKMGNSWVNITGPYAPIIRTIARTIAPTVHNGEWGLWSKGADGSYTNLLKSSDYGTNALDLAEGFFENKSSPLISTVLNIWDKRRAEMYGMERSALGVLQNLTTPISIKSFQDDMNNPKNENLFMSTLLNAIGFSTYTPQ